MIQRGRLLVLCLIAVWLFSCASYYKKNIKFHTHFLTHEFDQAAKMLEEDNDEQDGKNRLLYFLNCGSVYQMLGDYERSNTFFEKAHLFTEDYEKNYASEALALLTNPGVTTYRGEDYEWVLIHYYKAINFLQMGQYEEAVVECRRIDLKLKQINDQHGDNANRFKQDAFALNLMGMIYEAQGDINNAFIAYRNAYETYSSDYFELFSIPVPEQLKQDLMRTAFLMGFREELQEYETKFETTYHHLIHDGGELIVFWNNGMGPVKDQWSIDLALSRGGNNMVSFGNPHIGFSHSYVVSSSYYSKFSDLDVIRVAFPKFLERSPYCNSAQIVVDDQVFGLEVAQNINQIAFKCLEDRMVRDFITSLVRLAIKKASEQIVRNENETLGTILSIFNAATEQADTRNWQTIPYEIAYSRIPLPAGEHIINLETYPRSQKPSYQLRFEMIKDKIIFHSFYTLDSYAPKVPQASLFSTR